MAIKPRSSFETALSLSMFDEVRLDTLLAEIPPAAGDPVAPGAAMDDINGPSMFKTC